MNDHQPELLSQRIDQGVKKAIQEAIEKHRKLGQEIAVYQDGKVVTLTSENIPVQEEKIRAPE